MTAFIKFPKSSGEPIFMDFRSSSNFFLTAGQREDGMYALLAAEHFCPWYSNAPRANATATASASADECAITKSFPPVSPTILGYDRYRGRLFAMVCHNFWKTPVLPV